MEFRCVDECSQCCVEREYYPTKQFGKIGVLILPEEKENIEKLAELNKIKIKILKLSPDRGKKITKMLLNRELNKFKKKYFFCQEKSQVINP